MKSFSGFIAERFPSLKDMDITFSCKRCSWENVFKNLPLIQPESFQQIPRHIEGSLQFQGLFKNRDFLSVSFC